jgi:CubicO group peptidase (beta-lactamase class C family)
VPTLAQVLQQHASSIHVDFTPGTQHSYSNTGYAVLQQLTVDASGQPFDAYLQSRVLAPLGMAHSTFQPGAVAAPRASGHYAGATPLAGGYRVGPELAVAGLWTTPSDLARYLIAVQQWYAGATGGLITPQLTHQMLTPQIAYAGLGVVLSGEGNDTRFGHDGFNSGFEASMVGYVHGGKGAVVMANSGFAYMLIKEVLGSIARAYQWPHYDSTNQWPPSASITQQEVTPLPGALLSAAIGRYALDANTVIQIFARDKRLFLNWPGDGDAEIFRTPDERLFCPQLTFSELGDPFLRYTLAAQGSVTELLAAQGHVVLRRVN